MLTRQQLEEVEARGLASYAMKSVDSRGRVHEAAQDARRTDFQRDRDRIIHSEAFRKLEFKTQVFATFMGDYYRTRLTHTMEVAQIARTITKILNLNTDLAEAIALGHDLGHTPFGHAGEDSMRECMAGHGGFEHNAQGLRVVTVLEERNPRYQGLNLTYEVREGIIKHDTAYDTPDPHPEYNPGKSATLESQVCDISDEIAYNNADLDDALEMGLVQEKDLREVPWVYELIAEARRTLGEDARAKFVKYRVLASMYDMHINDALRYSQDLISKSGVKTVQDVYDHHARLVDFSPGFKEQLSVLKKFLLSRVYFHPKTMVHSTKAKRYVHEMFHLYLEHPDILPWKFQERVKRDDPYRVICDYIAGMTDRYLMEQYRASFLPEPLR